MLARFLVFLSIYVVFLIIILIVSFSFGYDSIVKTAPFKLLFILGVSYLPAAIIALIFRNTMFVKDLPYYIAGLATLVFIAVIVPAWVKSQNTHKTEWNQKFSSASRDFVCTQNSFITYSTAAGRLLKYSNEPGEENIEIIGDMSEDRKDLKPFFGKETSVEEFKAKYAMCKNKEGKTIFDVYGFKPDPYDLEFMKTKK